MRGFAFGLLCGAIVAAIATAVALELLREPVAAVDHAPAVHALAPVESTSRPAALDPADVARRLDGASDLKLAEALEAAAFDRSWERVNGVGRALRARGAARVDPLTGLADSPVVGPRARPVPLLSLELEIARRRLVLELRARDNPATRLLDRAGEDDAVRKLVDLFAAEARRPDYEPVRADAALVLAFGASDRGRDVLARAVREGPPERADLAARALGLSEDDKAFATLSDLVARDLDPEVRKRAAAGLSVSSAVARSSPEVVNALARAARGDADESVRVAALAALGGADLVRSDRARATLTELVASPVDPLPVRVQAVRTIQKHRATAHVTPSDLVDALLVALGTERDGPLRAAVADALARAVQAVQKRGEPPP